MPYLPSLPPAYDVCLSACLGSGAGLSERKVQSCPNDICRDGVRRLIEEAKKSAIRVMRGKESGSIEKKTQNARRTTIDIESEAVPVMDWRQAMYVAECFECSLVASCVLFSFTLKLLRMSACQFGYLSR